ncbi:hypothetical protein [Candidatus Enterococcus ikei]|uniref:Phage protein n=1 Tax=Candidatus Enterococcus ikei TaxID=2815326 RepID=A0ABS3GVS8_9ENTE|nr:hypothetical protein [Enterococcus sp. DIV0869a]MBO0438935.1 hypothetical protein [Enterococcus sp. DIV0869a]
MSEKRLSFSGQEFSLDRWGDSIYLTDAKDYTCTEIREFMPAEHEPQNAEYMLITSGIQPMLTREELNQFALKILTLTGYLPINDEQKQEPASSANDTSH